MNTQAAKTTSSVARALVMVGLLAASGEIAAATVDLCAGATTKTMPDGNVIVMWGYGLDTGSPCPVTVPGPALSLSAGDPALTVNLRNELDVPVSLVIAGQQAAMTPVFFTDAQGRQRVRSFTHETGPGATGVYEWNDLKPGSYLYSSGTHPAVQVQMGLYGPLVQDAALETAYPGVPYDNQLTLLYSEIDPDLHAAVAAGDYGPGLGTTSTIDYTPRYFLVNGMPHEAADLPLAVGEPGERVLLRLVNAGLESRSLVLQGDHMTLVAEDGNPYPWPREQYSVLLAAGTTRDAVFEPDTAGSYAIYDRRLRVGPFSELAVSTGAAGPSAANDEATVEEDAPASSIAVLANDTPTVNPIDPSTVEIAEPAINGQALANVDGTVSYTPNPDFNGADGFSYTVRDTLGNLSNPATVTVTVSPVNDLPVAVDDAFDVPRDEVDYVLEVLANDSDVDGDALTVVALGATDNGGTVGTDGSVVSYTPAPGFTGIETFGYDVADGNGGTASATVTVDVFAPVNEPPVANDDYATVTRNVGNSSNSVTIDVAANDVDADGAVVPATVTITVDPRKGSVVNNGDGTVTYTPASGRRGADAFGYTMRDDEGATSNEATVRVDIVR